MLKVPHHGGHFASTYTAVEEEDARYDTIFGNMFLTRSGSVRKLVTIKVLIREGIMNDSSSRIASNAKTVCGSIILNNGSLERTCWLHAISVSSASL